MENLLMHFEAVRAFVFTVDFAGLVFGVSGNLLLATKGRLAGWGFVAFLVSNLAWIAFGLGHGHVNLVTQHAIFAVCSLVGVWIWLLREPLARRLDRLFAAPHDTLQMEDEIWRRWNGRNAVELGQMFNISAGEVFDIVLAHKNRNGGERLYE